MSLSARRARKLSTQGCFSGLPPFSAAAASCRLAPSRSSIVAPIVLSAFRLPPHHPPRRVRWYLPCSPACASPARARVEHSPARELPASPAEPRRAEQTNLAAVIFRAPAPTV